MTAKGRFVPPSHAIRPFGLEAKPHKYRAKAVVVDGIRFASQAEARRWSELRLLERAGEIVELVRQPQFVFFVHEKAIFTYIADFKYFAKSNGRLQFGVETIEDVKGVRTPVYKLKKRLIEAQFGIKITEIG